MICNKYIGRSWSLIVFLFVSSTVSAQTNNSQVDRSIERIENNIIKIDKSGKEAVEPKTLLSRMQSLQIPGVSIAVFDEGHILWAKGYGVCEKNVPAVIDTTTLFQAASLSKPLTAVATFALAEKGSIDLDKDINLQLRSWKLPENDYTKHEKVTPRRVVSHMGGLSIHGFEGYHQKDVLPDLLQILNGSGPANSKPVEVIYQPGSKLVYSGGGYIVLQLLLEERTRRQFSDLMLDLVLNPLPMKCSVFALSLPDSISQNAAKGHLSNGHTVKGGYNVYPEQAAAGLWTTPSDYARFMIDVGNSYRSGKGILQQSTVRGMFTNMPAGNGSGFGIEGEDSTMRFSHLGSNVGYYCYAVSFAHKGRGLVVMTNSDNGLPLIKEIVKAVYREYGWTNK
jgi:CubicO group peptidase (beta-lactamase class C family)